MSSEIVKALKAWDTYDPNISEEKVLRQAHAVIDAARPLLARIEALEAENARLRGALELAAGALQAGQRSMAPRVAFTGDWAHLGTRSITEILDTANEALARRAREGGNHG